MTASTCPRCGTRKASSQFACRACWFDLPREVRSAIGNAYRRHGALTDPWVAAAKRAFEAWGIAPPRWLDVLADADPEAAE